ncbi:protocadherin Fat 4-like isoform X2 [Mytilus californianus]|uniref:protocadherin Fat 4-like isoform X2 n=1 Tax=Mytilus californianus TaxID=6549 RepID=UPI002245FE9F|nr:protocadherin Fat 4-like isoform X2 [Mytilus californianus]
MGTDSDVFTVKTVNTEMVTIALNNKLTKPKYDIFVVVSVTADGIVIRDFRHIAITVNKDSVIRKEIFIMDGTLKDSVVGRVCQSCLLFENMTQIDRDNIVSVENDGIIITSKTIDLNNIQGSTTIAYSTYVEIQQQFTSVTVANITIHIIRAKFECVLPEDSVANTVVGNLNLNNPFSIDSEFQMSGMSLTLGSVVLDYIEQIEVMKSLEITISGHTFDTTIMINVQDVNDKSPIFLAKPYNFFTLESAYPGLIVGVVSATDPDTNSVLTFSIIPNDKLLINEYGIISIQSGFGVNATSYNATVTVTDGLHPVTEYVTVDIEQATTNNLQNRFVGQISENVNSQVITKVNITGYTNYEFTDRSAHLDFSIDSKTGEVKNARAFDREKETEREFKYTIVANEEGELKCSLVVIGEITITVTDQNDEPPEFNSHSYTATVMENALEKLMVVPEISTTDKDLNPTVTYSISTYTNKFAIDSSTGTIRTISQIDREYNKSLTVGVVATDGVNSVTTTVTVKILDANDNNPQFDSGQNSVSVSENSSIGAHVTTILANDADDGKNADITFDLVSNGGPFRINQTAGEITVTGKLDRESSESHRVIIYARDNGKQIRSSSMSVTITVLDANDNPPVFTIDEIEVEFEENKNCSNRISTISATDADKSGSINSQITYSLLSGNGMHHFILDPSGILKCNKTLNYEEQSSYQITVKAQDNGSPPLSSTQSVIINLRDVNDNVPIFESPPTTITIRYFSATERVIEVFKATDKDSGENGRVTYSISGTAASFLSIDPSNGILRTKSSININNNNYTLQVIARDNGNPMKQRSTSVRVTVVKKGTNQPIQFTQQEINMTVKENRQINSPLESVSSKVTNTASVTLNYEIIDSSSDLAFDVNPTSGMVTLSKPVDREKNDIHEFVVRVKNQADNKESDLALVRVRIEDENDNKPTFFRSAYFFKVYENRAITTVVDPQIIKILARDVDIGDNAIIEFQLSGEGLYKECSSAFSLENAGENAQSIKLSKKVDYEVLKKCVFSIEAYNPNNRTMSTSVYVTVDILDYNDNPPEFTEQSSNNVFTVHLLEDTTINDRQNFGTVKDDDSGANGDIHLTVLNDDCWVTVTKDAEQLILQVKENANLDYESGPRLKDCIIKATDKGTPSLSSTVTLSMILVDVNDNRPVIANPNINTSVSRDADVGNTTIVNEIPATDADSGENGKLGYRIQASEHSSKFTIDADTGKITLNSPLLTVQKDKMSIAVIVSDKGDPPLSTTAMVSIHILDENPRPYFAQSETVNVTEHAPKPNGNLGIVEAYDRSGDQIIKCDCTYLLDTKREDIIIESNTGTIKFKNSNYALDRESEPYGKVTIGVIATDKGLPPKNSKTMPFTINILDINDHSPTFKDDYSFKIPQNAPEGTTIGTVTAYDIDEDPQTLYNISISNNGGFNETVVTIGNRTGKITTSGNLTLRSGQKGEIEGKVFAVDGKDPTKSPSRVGIKIKVEFDSNNKHAPVFQNTPYETAITWNLAAGSPITKVNATDADTGRSGNVTYSIIENSKREFFTVNNKDGVISLAYQLDSSIGDTDKVKLYLTIKAQDNGIVPKSSTTTVTLQVTGQNPGVCIQGAEHSKETQELEDERATWTIAVYVLVGLLCVFIVLSFFFVYKWRTSSPVISTPAERNKQTYFDNMEYDELEKRKTVEYSQSNQAFEPPRKDIDFTEQDPYQKISENTKDI